MAAQHVQEIDAAIKELTSSRRQEILQIAQNGANPDHLRIWWRSRLRSRLYIEHVSRRTRPDEPQAVICKVPNCVA